MSSTPPYLPVLTLPNTVLYPGADMPLRIYEPNQRIMIMDVLNTDKLLVITVMKNTWLENDFENPELYTVGTLATVNTSRQLVDGSYNIFVHGNRRVTLGETLPRRPYLLKQIAPLDEKPETDPPAEIFEPVRERIVRFFSQAAWQGVIGPFPMGAMDRMAKTRPANFIALTSALLGLTTDQQQMILELGSTMERMHGLEDALHARLLINASLGDRPAYSDGDQSH